MMFCYSFLVWHPKLLGVDICLQQNVYVPSEIMVFRCPFQPSGVVFTSAPCVSCEDSIVRCRILPFPAGTFPLGNIPSCSTIHYVMNLALTNLIWRHFFCKIVGQFLAKCVSMPARSSMDILHFCFVIATLNFCNMQLLKKRGSVFMILHKLVTADEKTYKICSFSLLATFI